MATRNDILIRIGADLADLKRELGEVKTAVNGTGQVVSSGFDGAKESLIGLGKAAAGAYSALATIRAAFGALKASIETAGEFEALRTRLGALYGDAKVGAQVFERLADVAATTPFELSDVVEAGASLKAFGADAENLTKSIADLAAFMGTSATEAAQAFGRAFAGGAGAADVLREKGVLELVKSFNGIEDLTKVTLPEFRQALIDSIEDPAAGIAGATDQLAQTFTGKLSNMQDSISQLANAVGSTLLPGIKDAFGEIIEIIDGDRQGFEQLFGVDQVSAIQDQKARLDTLAATFFALSEKQALSATEQKVLKDTMKEMVDIAPEYLGNLDLEKDSWDQITSAINDATDALDRQVRAKILKEELVKIDRERFRLEEAQRAIIQEQTRDTGRLVSLTNDYRLNIASLVEDWKRDVISALDAVGRAGNLTAEAGVDDLKRAIVQSVEAIGIENEKLNGIYAEGEEQLAALTAEYNRLLGLMQGYERSIKSINRETRTNNDLNAKSNEEAEKAVKVRWDGIMSYEEWTDKVAMSALLMDQEAAYMEKLRKDWPDLAEKIDKTVESMDKFNTLQYSLQVATQAMGEAMVQGFAGSMDGLRDALREGLLTIISAKVSAIAQAIIKGGLNPLQGLMEVMKSLPLLLGIEAMFAGLKTSVTGFELGGVVDKPTLALIGENVSASGREIVAPERTFKQWANESLKLQGSSTDTKKLEKLLSSVDQRLSVLETELSGRRLGKTIGREISRSARGRL